MALTDKQKQIACDAYLSTLSGGEFLDVYAAAEAVLADQDERIHNALNAEQTSAAEQGLKLTCPYCISGDRHPQSTQPPAGDVLEWMYEAFDNEGGTGNYRQAMAAALAVAQQERDAQWEKAIRGTWYDKYVEGNNFEGFIEDIRNRLAKPAERVTVERNHLKNWDVMLDGIRTPDFSFSKQIDAERYANGLREELKAGKQ